MEPSELWRLKPEESILRRRLLQDDQHTQNLQLTTLSISNEGVTDDAAHRRRIACRLPA